MTRCVACNKNLSDYETTRKHAVTGEYLDMCNECYNEVAKDIMVIERADLADVEMEDWDEERMDIIGPNGNDGLHYGEN